MLKQIASAANQSLSKPSKNSNDLAREERAAKMAARLFSFCPPQDVANDSRMFLVGVVELFLAYPESIVERAISVVDGLPSKHKWAPRIAEIKEHLEELMVPIRRQEGSRRTRACLSGIIGAGNKSRSAAFLWGNCRCVAPAMDCLSATSPVGAALKNHGKIPA